MPFAEFGKLNKKVTDLLDFTSKTELSVKRTTASGVKIETTTTSGKSLAGKVKGTVKDKAVGELSFEGDSSGQFKNKAKLTKLADNLVATVEHAVGPKTGGKHTGAVGITFSQPQFDFSTKLNVAEGAEVTGKLDLSVVGGQDGVTAGVNVKADVFPKQNVTDYNFAVSYKQGDTFGAFTTEKKVSQFNLWIAQTLNSTTRLAVKATRLAAKPEEGRQEQLSFAVERDLDSDTTFKTALDSAGQLNAEITHKLSNPAWKFTLGATATPSVRNYAASSVVCKLALGE